MTRSYIRKDIMACCDFIYERNIICFLTVVSYTELYNLFNMYMFVVLDSE